jgi:excisionase family DNA binding protein
MDAELLTVAEAAAFLRTTPNAVYLMISRGRLPGVTRVGRRVLVRQADLRGLVGLLPCPASNHPAPGKAA